MKKLLYSAAALALAFFAGSCQRENLEPVGTGSNTVTYSVQVPDAIATKANPGSVAGVTELVYEVYRLDADDNIVSLAYEDVVTLQGGETKWDLELEFVKDQKFQVLFWAQKPNVGAYNTGDLREVSLNSAELTANVDDYAAFAGYDYVTNCVSHKEGKVTLVRPISQIQVGTDAAGLVLGTEGSNKVNITLSTSSMVVKGLPTTYNVANGEVVEDVQDVEYTVYNVPAGTFTANSKEYTYVAQNYVAFAASLGTTVEVDFTVTTSEGDVEHTVSNVPLKPNYRTNIIGNLITENADYSIDLEENWADNDKSMEVIVDGLVKNINGDYEVTEAKGLAYAINKLFAVGGNFYLTKSLYDLSGFAVTPPTVPAGVTLNIYGETPVVTRSSVIPTVAGVTIIGLDSALIGSIANEANVSISGVNLTDSGSVLVNENLGTLVVSESTASTIVASGNAVDADNVQDINSLNAALATGVKEINITADIEATEVVLVDRSVVINGNDKSFASTATRAFRLTTSDIEVTINNLNIVSNAVRVGTNDVRGVSIDIVNNVSLTLNNCSHAFSDSSANDWAYAVNVTGGDNNEVTVIGGEYEGANVINVRGTSQTVVVKNAILTSTYPASKDYYGACIYVVQNQGSSVYAEGNTFNGNNAMVFNIGEGTALEEKNNVDNTMFYHKGCYYVSSAEKLQTLVNNLTEDATIKFANDLSGKISLTQNAGVDVTILGEGKKFTGGLHIWGNGAADDRSMTIKNINFDGTGLTDDEGCIYTTGAVNGRNSYACNVTIEDCTFTGAGVAAIRQNVAGERDWTIKNCTVAENMHSLLQVSNTNGELVVENCKVYSKNGANLNSTCVATFTGCEFDVRGYAVRVGVNSGGNPDATKLYTFTNCSFESENEDGDAVVIIRKDAQKATLNFVNTELIGDPKISGFTDETHIDGVNLYQAKIADKVYVTLYDAVKVAKNGDTITLLDDAELEFIDNPQYNNVYASKIDLNGKTLTIKDSDIRFDEITILNGSIVVEPGLSASTAIFLMYDKNITFNDVDITATGLTGTYLIGQEGTSNLNLINSEILIDNPSLVSLIAAIACNGSGTTTIENSNISVKNINGRALLNVSCSVVNSTVTADYVKAGFYIPAGKSLSIDATSTVTITNLVDGKVNGIDLYGNAEYNVAEGATVNATVGRN